MEAYPLLCHCPLSFTMLIREFKLQGYRYDIITSNYCMGRFKYESTSTCAYCMCYASVPLLKMTHDCSIRNDHYILLHNTLLHIYSLILQQRTRNSLVVTMHNIFKALINLTWRYKLLLHGNDSFIRTDDDDGMQKRRRRSNTTIDSLAQTHSVLDD